MIDYKSFNLEGGVYNEVAEKHITREKRKRSCYL